VLAAKQSEHAQLTFTSARKEWLGDLDSNQDSQIHSQETESTRVPKWKFRKFWHGLYSSARLVAG